MAVIVVKHPDFGVVEFSSPTPRQQDILELYQKLYSKNKKEPNAKKKKDKGFPKKQKS